MAPTNSNATSSKPSKPVFVLDTPFSPPSWPSLSDEDEEIITDMLCGLLSPIRQRQCMLQPSKGKKSRRRRKQMQRSKNQKEPLLPLPDVQSYITIGLNSTTRHLESLAALSSRATLARLPWLEQDERVAGGNIPALAHVDAIFLSQPSQDILYAHLPLLAVTASMAHPELPRTRHVALKEASGARLANVMGLPRAGVIGILRSAPGAAPLLNYLREHTSPTACPWLEEAANNKFKEVRVDVKGK